MLSQDELDYIYDSAREIYYTMNLPVSFEYILMTVAKEYIRNSR